MSRLASTPGPFGPPRLHAVLARHRETRDTVTLEVDDAPGSGFMPGQFNMLYAFGQGEIPISISGGTARGRLSHTVRAVGPVSAAVAGLRRDSVIGIRGPFGHPWPLNECQGQDVVVVAGGLGMAPLRPVVHAVLGARERYGRLDLLYGARTPADLLFARELDRWRSGSQVRVAVTVDAAPGGWHGSVGVVTGLFRQLSCDPRRTVAMVCGPEVMMRFAVKGLQDLGLPADAIWVSLERNMQCGAGVCGHCQLGGVLVCRDGPVFRFSEVEHLLGVREL